MRSSDLAEMIRQNILLTLVAVLSLFSACNSRKHDLQGIDLLDGNIITEVRVKVLDTGINGEKMFKTISTSNELYSVVSFANQHVLVRSDVMTTMDEILYVQDRSTQVNLAFYQSDQYLGNLGLGFYGRNKYFIKYRQYSKSNCCKTKAAVISNEQKRKLLELIGYPEQEFENMNLIGSQSQSKLRIIEN